MRTLILESGTYRVFAEWRECVPEDRKQLRILTQFTDSKNPDELQVKFAITLNDEERKRLKEFL